MRPFLAVIIWVVFIGGLGAYMQHREAATAPKAQVQRHAEGAFSLEITPTFALETDPFALQSGGVAPAVLSVRVNGNEVVRLTDPRQGQAAIRVEPVPGLVEGNNEFYVEANPPAGEASTAHAARMRIYRDGLPVADRVLWADAGARIAEAFQLTVEPEHVREEHSHAK
jgi:hypothetical protein